MPWCPVCRNEYKEGYTLCADCGAELVESLDDDNEIRNDLSDELLNEPEEITVDAKISDSLAEESEVLRKKKAEPVKMYVKASERAQNYKSSAFSLLIVGCLGIIFLVLSYLHIIPLNLAANINVMFYIVMGLMFVAFIVIGVKTLKDAKSIEGTASGEESLTDNIYGFFKENYTSDKIDGIVAWDDKEQLSDEEKFFPRSVCIRKIITDNFGELDEAYLTELTETVYSDIFDK